MPRVAAFAAAALLVAGAASGQERPVISLTPVDPPQWDIAGHVAWVAGHKSNIGAEWDDWYNAFSGGVSAGRYLSPHLKSEIHGAMASEGLIYTQDPMSPTGPFPVSATAPFPIFRSREHSFRTATVGAGMSYQFFENQWFHPFIGGGLEVLREHHRVQLPEQFLSARGPAFPAVVVPAVTFAPEVSYAAHPFVATGFKWYVAERTFVRANVQASFSRRGTTRVVWAAGIGADL